MELTPRRIWINCTITHCLKSFWKTLKWKTSPRKQKMRIKVLAIPGGLSTWKVDRSITTTRDIQFEPNRQIHVLLAYISQKVYIYFTIVFLLLFFCMFWFPHYILLPLSPKYVILTTSLHRTWSVQSYIYKSYQKQCFER